MSLLFLNSISGGEIVIIFMIVLMLFGADSIPSIARNLGRGIRQVKDATQDIQRDIANAANVDSDDIKDIKEQFENVIKNKDVTKIVTKHISEVKEVTDTISNTVNQTNTKI